MFDRLFGKKKEEVAEVKAITVRVALVGDTEAKRKYFKKLTQKEKESGSDNQKITEGKVTFDIDYIHGEKKPTAQTDIVLICSDSKKDYLTRKEKLIQELSAAALTAVSDNVEVIGEARGCINVRKTRQEYLADLATLGRHVVDGKVASAERSRSMGYGTRDQ